MNIKGSLGGGGLHEQQLKEMCVGEKGDVGARQPEEGDGTGTFAQSLTHQVDFKNTFFLFSCSCLAAVGSLWCQGVPGPRPTALPCQCLRPQTSIRSQVFGEFARC